MNESGSHARLGRSQAASGRIRACQATIRFAPSSARLDLAVDRSPLHSGCSSTAMSMLASADDLPVMLGNIDRRVLGHSRLRLSRGRVSAHGS